MVVSLLSQLSPHNLWPLHTFWGFNELQMWMLPFLVHCLVNWPSILWNGKKKTFNQSEIFWLWLYYDYFKTKIYDYRMIIVFVIDYNQLQLLGSLVGTKFFCVIQLFSFLIFVFIHKFTHSSSTVSPPCLIDYFNNSCLILVLFFYHIKKVRLFLFFGVCFVSINLVTLINYFIK